MRRHTSRKLLALAAASAASLSSAAAAQQAYVTPVYTVTVKGGGLGLLFDEVTVISHLSVRGASSTTDLWLAEQRRYNSFPGRIPEGNDRGSPGTVVRDHRWLDSRTCPALLATLNRLASLPPAGFGTPSAVGSGFAFDAAMTTLRGPPAYGVTADEISRSEHTGPVAEWWGQSERDIEPCWTTKRPQIANVRIEEHLSSEADADAWARRRPDDDQLSRKR